MKFRARKSENLHRCENGPLEGRSFLLECRNGAAVRLQAPRGLAVYQADHYPGDKTLWFLGYEGFHKEPG